MTSAKQADDEYLSDKAALATIESALLSSAAAASSREQDPTIASLEQSLIAQEEAARHFYEKYVSLRKAVFDAVEDYHRLESKVGTPDYGYRFYTDRQTDPIIDRLWGALK